MSERRTSGWGSPQSWWELPRCVRPWGPPGWKIARGWKCMGNVWESMGNIFWGISRKDVCDFFLSSLIFIYLPQLFHWKESWIASHMEVLGDHAQNACLSGQGQGVGSGQIGIGCGHSQDEAVPLRAETEMGISPGKTSFFLFSGWYTNGGSFTWCITNNLGIIMGCYWYITCSKWGLNEMRIVRS